MTADAVRMVGLHKTTVLFGEVDIRIGRFAHRSTLARELQSSFGMNAKQAALTNEAMVLFGVKTEKMIQTALYALGFRQPCGRCGGSGHYSYNQMDGTRCYGCNGKKNVVVKLTRKVLDEAKVKVDAGELVRIRERGAVRIAARKAIEEIEPTIEALYAPIGAAHSREFDAVFNDRGNWDNERGCRKREFDETISRAQDMNNSLRRAYWNLQRDVKYGHVDAVRAMEQVAEIIALFGVLKDEWARFNEGRS